MQLTQNWDAVIYMEKYITLKWYSKSSFHKKFIIPVGLGHVPGLGPLSVNSLPIWSGEPTV